MLTVTLIAAFLNLLLLGAVFGVFFTYSNSIIPGLNQTDPEKAVETMRKMNVAIINPTFMATFIGPVLTSTATAILMLTQDEPQAATLYFTAAAIYFLGCHAVTGKINIPLNNTLENNTSTNWQTRWSNFSPKWRRWNTVRTLSSGTALLLCTTGLYLWSNN